MPTVPTCHRTLAPDPHPRYLYDRRRVSEAEIEQLRREPPGAILAVSDPAAITRLGGGCPCIGSGCALWVPETRTVFGNARPTARDAPTGEGHCADNPKVVRADPAADAKKEHKDTP